MEKKKRAKGHVSLLPGLVLLVVLAVHSALACHSVVRNSIQLVLMTVKYPFLKKGIFYSQADQMGEVSEGWVERGREEGAGPASVADRRDNIRMCGKKFGGEKEIYNYDTRKLKTTVKTVFFA